MISVFFFLFCFSLWWCCFCLTLAFSTVQCKELVALSYKRSNSKVPREARKQFRKKSRQMHFFFFVCNTVTTKAKPSGKVNVTLPHTKAGARTFRRAAVEQANDTNDRWRAPERCVLLFTLTANGFSTYPSPLLYLVSAEGLFRLSHFSWQL